MRNKSLSVAPTSQETVWGAIYMAFELLALPGLLNWFNRQMTYPLVDAELNFIYFLMNFLAILWIFRDYLGRSAAQVRRRPFDFIQAVILGAVAYFACVWAMEKLMRLAFPGFTNYNDKAIAALRQGNYFLTLIGTVILVPPVEECFFRGLIFRNLYGKSRVAAYVVSILAFAVIHIIGYIGAYSPLELLLAVLQYLPAGLWLAWAYTKSDTVFTPIVIHGLINYIGIYRLR